MSAYRDSSQGVAFVFTNLYESYIKSKKSNGGNGFIPEPVDVMAFRPRINGQSPGPIKKTTVQTKRSEDIQKLNEKLVNLQNVHNRLKFMINELNTLVDKKKKGN